MPPAAALVVTGVAAGLGAAALGATIFGLGTTLSAIVIGLGATATSFISQALSPSLPNLASFEQQVQSRTALLRQPITARRLPFGEVILSGPLTFYDTSTQVGLLGGWHHMVITLGDAPAAPWEAIPIVWLDDTPVFEHQIGGDGFVTLGKFTDAVRIKKHLGGPNQLADPDLIAAIDRLDDNFRGRGVAYLYIQLDFQPDLFPRGLPNVRALCLTNRPFDIRDGVRKFTPNAALALHEYLRDPAGGLGYDAADRSFSHAVAAANVCDEFVDCAPVGHAVVIVQDTVDALDLAVAGDGAPLRLETGDRVELFLESGGAAPGGLSAATDYYVIIDRLVGQRFGKNPVNTGQIALDDADYTGAAAEAIAAGNVDRTHVQDASGDPTVGIHARVQLATSFADALAGTNAVTITSAGSGQHVLIKTGEPRYACSGVLEADRSPKDNIDDLLSAMAGTLAWTGGEFRISAGAAPSGTTDLDESDLMGPIVVRSRHSRRERFNSVRGIFATPLAVGEVTDYPPVIDDAYVAADGGTRIWGDLPLRFTSRVATAQRIAKIKLSQHRREIRVDYPTTLKGLHAVPGSVVNVTNARRGWVSKTFVVESMEDAFYPVEGAGEETPPLQGVLLHLAETDASVYDFDPDTDETIKPPAAIPPGGNPFEVLAPSPPNITESLYETRDGAGVRARATLTWQSNDAFAISHQVEHKRAGNALWTVVPPTTEETIDLDDLKPGVYDFRVKTINALGAASAYAQRRQEIFGLLPPPTEPQSLTITALGGLAVLRWDPTPDLDVRIGGKYVFRHSQAQSGATWGNSVSIGNAIPGSETVAVLPLKPGTYLVKAIDSEGVPSTSAAAVSTKGAKALTFSNLDTVSEHSAFSGAKTNVVVAAGVLKLDVDGGGGVLPSGTYDFAAGIDLTTVKRVRLASTVTASVASVNDLIDDWPDIDSRESWDGGDVAAADMTLWARETDDDPAVSPTWSAWQRLDAAEYEARAFEFQARLTSDDDGYNIHVTELTVDAEEVV